MFANLNDKSESSIRQYNTSFQKLCKFVRENDIQEMSENHAISFFRSLHEGVLAPGTITTAKSGLNLVFYYGFKMDLNDRIFASIPKACAKLRPAESPYMLSWSLNKVLKLASETDNDSCSIQLLLRHYF